VDRLRLVNGVEDNLRHNPNTFLPVDSDNDATNGSTPDTDLAFDASDPNAGANPSVVAVAYDRNDNDPATATTLFGIDSGVDALVTVGGVNGIPSPNGGLLFTRGSLGVNVSDLVALDSAPAPGAGVLWAAAQPVGATASTLYTVNALGTALSRGTIAAPLLGGLSIAPGGGVRVPAAFTPVTEAGPAAVVRVERRGDTLAPASVPYRTVDRTAVAGSDYTPVSGTLAFGQGVRSLDVAIPVTQDSAVEGTEVLALQLDKPTGGAVRETQVHSVQIADDDTVPPAPAVIAPDVTAPVFLAAPEVPDSVAALRRAGRLRVSFACSEACTVRFTLSLGRTTVGTALAVLQQPGVRNATLRVSRAGRRALDKARRARSRRKVSLVLRGTATDGAGNVASRRTSLGLLRR
jgi:hypothetical protein